eukprot:gene9369-10344_t
MSGHRHNPTAATQNQGNSLGDRSCVRQSKLYRVHESGNNMKNLLGTSHLSWDSDKQQGAYDGRPVYDHQDPSGGAYQSSTRGELYQRHLAKGQDSYANSSYETSSSNYGYGAKQAVSTAQPPRRSYDENFSNNTSSYEGGRRGYGQSNVSSAMAGSLNYDDDRDRGYSGGHGKSQGHGQSNSSSAMAGSLNYDDDRDRGYGGGYGKSQGYGQAAAAAPGYAQVKNQYVSDSDSYGGGSYARQDSNYPYALSAVPSVAATMSNRRTSFGQQDNKQDRSTRPW